TSSYYLGVSGMALGLVAAFHVRDKRVWLLGSVLILTLVLAMGNSGHLYPWLLRAFPPLGLMRYPIKFMFLAGICQALLAAFGVQRFGAAAVNHRRELWPTLLIIVASFVLAGLAIVWFDRCFPAGIEYIAFWTGTWKNALMRLTFLIGALIALYCGHDSKKPQFQRLLALLFVSLLFADFVTHVPRQNPTLPRSAFLPGISSLHVSTRTAKDRAMVSPSAHDLLFGNPYPDMLIDFLRGRMGL